MSISSGRGDCIDLTVQRRGGASYTYGGMKNRELADIFERMADLLELLGADRFRVNSYRKSARTIGDHSEAVEDLTAAGRLEQVPGIGKSTAEKVREYLKTGRIDQYEQLKAQVPPGLPGLLDVAGLGPKTVARLWKEGKVTSVEELKQAIQGDRGRLEKLEGLGPRKIEQIAESLEFAESAGGRIRLGEAAELAEMLCKAVRGCRGAKRVTAAGSLRRGRETIGDIDILCEATRAAGPKIIEAFAGAPNVRRVTAGGRTKGSVVLEGGVQADLRVVQTGSFGAALAYFTGSKDHNVRLRELAIRKGLKLNEYGLFDGQRQVAGADEQGIYEALGMSYVPPELREDRGEIEAAAAGKLPKLLELADIRGDLHMHTTASDGRNTIEEMIEACRNRGYEYMCISEHSRGQVQANGLDARRLAAHAEAIRTAAEKYKDITVLVGCEVDIFKDGRLDFGASVLGELDFVTASAHSALSLGRAEATARLVRAIEHPHVHCIGHPSGRLINKRPGMEIDIELIARAAAANDVALEINAHYWRLDLRDVHVRAAVAAGAKVIISTDAHGIDDLDMMKYGVITARRGWARAGDVVNTYSLARLSKWISRK